MAFTFVDPDEVPAPPVKTGPSQAKFFHDFLDQLPEGKVGVLEIPEGKTARGYKVSIGRVASSKKMSVVTWDNAENGADATVVYVKRTY